MANQGKHTKSLLMDLVEGEDSVVPTKSRGSHIVDSYIKRGKLTVKKTRKPLVDQPPQKPDIALVREPAPISKTDLKHSQAASWEHQKKVERLTPLRAPYQYKGR